MTTSIPLREGLFRSTPNGPTLLASRCTTCGQVVFPTRDQCLACRSAALDVVELGSAGELLCATTVHMATQNTAPGDAVGYVTLPHGVRVFAPIDTTDGSLPEPGTMMRLRIAPLSMAADTDETNEVLAYRFAPAGDVSADA